MAKERCLKKAFQDSLEDIKERMKEKRNKKLAKVATVSKALSTKTMIIGNNQTTATLKGFQANNKALALALEAEKSKTRQAQDIILHLKREHQRLMFEIFLLKRKLSMQQASSQADAKLSSLKDIIAKVTHNLLETANLLGPAHALCSPNNVSISTPTAMDERGSTPAGTRNSLGPTQNPAATDWRRNANRMLESSSVPERRNSKDMSLEKCDNGPAVKRVSRGRKSSLNRQISDETSDTEPAEDTSYLKNVSMRRRASSLNVCIEECSLEAPEPEHVSPVKGCLEESTDGKIVDLYPYQSPSNDELVPFTKGSEISTSTPEAKPKQVSKAKCESRPGRERMRKSKADGAGSSQLKKPWEKPKPRTRSKSRERGASNAVVSKDKLNSSLNLGDAYDFFCEESIHVTPFRQNKESNNPEAKEDPEVSCETSSSSEYEQDDSLYVPSKVKSKKRGTEQATTFLPLRPRSKRNRAQQQLAENLENGANEQPKADLGRGKKNPRTSSKVPTGFNEAMQDKQSNKENPMLKCAAKKLEQALDIHVVGDNFVFSADKSIYDPDGPAQRISLSDVTNFPACSGSNDTKKHSFPFTSDRERKLSETGLRKRRCTVTVNYAEPSLIKKLRRGDPFTDTEFLSSPIFKGSEQARKSLSRKSLARYNEAFVGCGR